MKWNENDNSVLLNIVNKINIILMSESKLTIMQTDTMFVANFLQIFSI
jgi:hypothetical protein